MGSRALAVRVPFPDRLGGLAFYGLAVSVNVVSIGYAPTNHHGLVVSAVEVGLPACSRWGSCTLPTKRHAPTSRTRGPRESCLAVSCWGRSAW